MASIIREGDLARDRLALIELIRRHQTARSDDRRFDWLYLQNPQGRARAYVAVDSDSERIVGAVAVFPRRLYVAGGEVRGAVLGDFRIDDGYRSLGPAVALQRACLAEVDSGQIVLCYDFPSSSMMAVYRRLGIAPFRQMLGRVKPLRVDRKVRERVKSRSLAAGLTAVGNLVLALGDRRPRRNGLSVSLHDGRFGEEFSDLARKVGNRCGACVQRTTDYLNWRYPANPLYSCEVPAARRDGVR